MRKKAFPQLLFFLLIALFSRAQNEESNLEDSLRKVITQAAPSQKLAPLKVLILQLWRKDLTEALKLAKELKIGAEERDSSDYVAFALNFEGICFMQSGQPDSADRYFGEAIAFSRDHHIQEIEKKALLNRGINFHGVGRYEKALAYTQEALITFERIGDSLGIGHAFYNIGNNYFRLKQYERADQFYRKALPIYAHFASPFELANLYNSMGSLSSDLKAYGEAIRYFEKSIQIKLKIAPEGYCASEYNNLATAFMALGDLEKAERYLRKSMVGFEEVGHVQNRLSAVVNLADLLGSQGRIAEARKLALEALATAEAAGDLFFQQEALQSLGGIAENTGNHQQALAYYKAYQAIKDSISSSEVKSTIEELQLRFEAEKREKEILQKDASLSKERLKVKQRNNLIVLLSAGFFLLIIVGYFLFRQQQLKRKRLAQQALIDLQKERLRISRDLHDNLGAELTLISGELDKKAFQTRDIEEQKVLENLSENARNAMSLLRETIWAIRNDSVSLEAFAAKLNEYAGKVAHPSGVIIHFNLEAQPEKQLGPAQTIHLYRICQEAVTNALKHSGCREIKIAIRESKNATFNAERLSEGSSVGSGAHLEITIEDNGGGFASESIRKGYGLQNMQQRSVELGSKLSFEPVSTGGTRVRISLKLNTR